MEVKEQLSILKVLKKIDTKNDSNMSTCSFTSTSVKTNIEHCGCDPFSLFSLHIFAPMSHCYCCEIFFL